jgi:deoxyadenosine/deoxycytidine kinase
MAFCNKIVKEYMKTGKIIAIVGAPRSGKSFLAKKLADKLNAELLLEGEENTLPARIIEDIAKNIRPLERMLWFRTEMLNHYLNAVQLRNNGKLVIMDAFWMLPHAWINVLLKGFERELMWSIANQDRKQLGWPDLVIYLKNSEKDMRKLIKMGGRSYEQSEACIQEQYLPVNKTCDELFAKRNCKNILIIKRDGLDFGNDEDFNVLLKQIKPYLKTSK